MKKGVKKGENGFDSKDDCISTQFLSLKTSELENVFFIKVVDIFDRFHLTTYLLDYDIRTKSYGKDTKTMHRGAKNPIFGIVWQKLPAAVRKNLAAAKKCGK